jgi:hypothetical protein
MKKVGDAMRAPPFKRAEGGWKVRLKTTSYTVGGRQLNESAYRRSSALGSDTTFGKPELFMYLNGLQMLPRVRSPHGGMI